MQAQCLSLDLPARQLIERKASRTADVLHAREEQAMSQAVIDFCENLKTFLLGVEANLEKANASLNEQASHARTEAQKHVDAATTQVAAFKSNTAALAKTLRENLPNQQAAMEHALKDAGAEAQVALRHAVVYLAEATSKGATGAAVAFQHVAAGAHTAAENLKRETALVSAPEKIETGPETKAT